MALTHAGKRPCSHLRATDSPPSNEDFPCGERYPEFNCCNDPLLCNRPMLCS